jgi:DNA-binding IclR family transcriptional regulator
LHGPKGNATLYAVATKSAGEALDALTTELGDEEMSTLVIVRHHRPDRFFTAEQIAHLEELMARWRTARDGGLALSDEEQDELDSLIEAVLHAAANRADAIADEVGR